MFLPLLAAYLNGPDSQHADLTGKETCGMTASRVIGLRFRFRR